MYSERDGTKEQTVASDMFPNYFSQWNSIYRYNKTPEYQRLKKKKCLVIFLRIVDQLGMMAEACTLPTGGRGRRLAHELNHEPSLYSVFQEQNSKHLKNKQATSVNQ